MLLAKWTRTVDSSSKRFHSKTVTSQNHDIPAKHSGMFLQFQRPEFGGCGGEGVERMWGRVWERMWGRVWERMWGKAREKGHLHRVATQHTRTTTTPTAETTHNHNTQIKYSVRQGLLIFCDKRGQSSHGLFLCASRSELSLKKKTAGLQLRRAPAGE